MGQYFIFVNLDKREYIVPDGGVKLWEICANASGAGILAYLLADGEKDGTGLLKSARDEEVKNVYVANGWKIHHEGEISGKKYWILEKETKYFGRWSGDRIVVAGDYGHTKLYENAKENKDGSWKDITKEAYEEFYEFMNFKPKKYPQNPDMLITAEGVYQNPKLNVPQ